MPDFGEEVKAVVQPRKKSEAELMVFFQQHLSKFRCPRGIDFEKELPRTSTGNLLKRILKKRFWNIQKK